MIACVNHRFEGRNGARRSAALLAGNLATRYPDLVLLSDHAYPAKLDHLEAAGVERVIVNAETWRRRLRQRVHWTLRGRRGTFASAPIELDLAIVGTHWSDPCWRRALSRGVRLAPGGKQVLICRSTPDTMELHGDDPATAAAIHRRYDKVVCVSQTALRAWQAIDGVPEGSTFIHNTCNEPAIEAAKRLDRDAIRRELGLRPDDFLALCLGSLGRRKGQDLIIDQLPDVRCAAPHVKLICCGPGRKTIDDLRDRAKRLGVADHVKILPATHEPERILRAADAMLVPSRAEAFGLVVIEAMAMGVPVVASNVGGIPEIVEHDRTGWLFPIDQPERLGEGLRRLAAEPDRAARYVDAAALRFQQHFSIDQHRRAFERMIAETLGDRAPTPSDTEPAANPRDD